MRRPVSSWRVLIIGLLVAMTGCVPTQPFYLHEDGDLSHYIDHATEVQHPDLNTDLLTETTQSTRPLSVSHPEFKEFWDLTLEECVAIALLNSKTIRGGAAARLQNGWQYFQQWQNEKLQFSKKFEANREDYADRAQRFL